MKTLEYRGYFIFEEVKNPPQPLEAFRTVASYPYSFFLDSATDPKKLGRYSLLGCDPFLVFKSKGDRIDLEWRGGEKEHLRESPFHALRAILSRCSFQHLDTKLPFTCGAVGYFGYDMKDFVERLPDIAEDDLALPDCVLGFYDTAIIYDNLREKCYGVAVGGSSARSRLEELKNHLRGYEAHTTRNLVGGYRATVLRSNYTKESYMEAVRKAKEYIKAGDIYQVNLSQRFEAELCDDPLDLYVRLRALSPAPFASFLNLGSFQILSSSPERFLMKRGEYIETRPIKGTRPRGTDSGSDLLMERELLKSGKDRAEHVMIVDLERNDLGRICEYGSIRPEEFIILEKYANVFHLVSTVSGRVKPATDPVSCLEAAFPGGSITGAPKIRAMEIIEELENVKRSIYTGAIGYISFNGNMDTSIVIRTLIVKDKRIYFQVGGGIVADSDPAAEYDETLYKARGIMSALAAGHHASEKVCV